MADKKATRNSYGEYLAQVASKDENVFVLDADLSGSTQTGQFKKVCPERFFNMGIAEQNMYAAAAGMASTGKTVFASTFAMFASGRAYEIIRNSIGYPGANVKICASHAGLTVGDDGASHQANEDLALMRVIPGMTVVNPADDISAKKLLEQVHHMTGPAYVRLGRSAVPIVYDESADIILGKGNVIREGNDVGIIATGIMVDEAIKAAEILAGKGINARVIDMHTIKPLDEDLVAETAAMTKCIVTAEEHSVIGGLGSAVADVIVRRCPVPVRMIGVQDQFGQSGKPDILMKEYGLTAENIVNAVIELK